MADITATPSRLNITVWGGNTEKIELTWPTGSLDGTGPWTAAATFGTDPLDLPVSVDGDVQTITLPAETADHLHEPGSWELTDESSEDVVLAGTFRVTDQPGPSTLSETVEILNETVTVSVLSDAPVSSVNGQTGNVVLDAADVGADPAGSAQAVADDLAAHEALDIGDVHGVVEHNWGRNTWDDFTIIVRTPDPDADWVRTVEDGKGVVTAVQPSGGSGLRTAAVRPGTGWVDAEIRSLILPPSKWTGTNTQMGHTHRLREISPGLWEAINIWTSVVFGGDYGTLHIAAVRNDGINPTLQSGIANDSGPEAAFIDRRSAIRAHTRFSFGSDFNVYRITPNRGLLETLVAGDVVTVADMDDTTFNETDIALDSPPDRMAEQVRVIDPSETTPVAWTDDFGGHITPSSTSAQKRWAPFYMATRVVGGSSSSVPVEIKRWRKGEPEPGWDDTRVRRIDVVPNANVPEMPLGPGLHGILDAHLHDDTSQSWGDIQFRRL